MSFVIQMLILLTCRTWPSLQISSPVPRAFLHFLEVQTGQVGTTIPLYKFTADLYGKLLPRKEWL